MSFVLQGYLWLGLRPGRYSMIGWMCGWILSKTIYIFFDRSPDPPYKLNANSV